MQRQLGQTPAAGLKPAIAGHQASATRTGTEHDRRKNASAAHNLRIALPLALASAARIHFALFFWPLRQACEACTIGLAMEPQISKASGCEHHITYMGSLAPQGDQRARCEDIAMDMTDVTRLFMLCWWVGVPNMGSFSGRAVR